MSHGQVFGEVNCKIVDIVDANAVGCWQVVVTTHVDVDGVFVELVRIELHSP